MARSLFRQILIPLVCVALLSAILVAAASWGIMERLYAGENDRAFIVEAEGLVASLPPSLPRLLASGPILSGDPGLDEARAWAKAVALATGRRITLVATDGSVLVDSMTEAWTMANHLDRPEVREALSGRASAAGRAKLASGPSPFQAASPIFRPGAAKDAASVVGVLRLSGQLPGMAAGIRPPRLALGLWLLAISLAVAAAAALFSRRVSRPLASLALSSRDLASGGRQANLALKKAPAEISTLATGLASMSVELERRIALAEAEGRERAAILDGMAEAVIALDRSLRIRMANPEARRLFGWEAPPGPEGLGLLLATRSTDLEAAARACLESASAMEIELALYGDSERWFQAFVTPLGGQPSGGLVLVLNDITRLRRLERVRKDFVANVSHELRTPIQLIKGFTEALSDGGQDEPERRAHFLSIMASNASRMENLIDDLLTLARLEQEGSSWLKLEDVEVAPLLEEAVGAVGAKAGAKGIGLDIDCEEGLHAALNAGLFVQALVNLLDNGIKYSPEGSRVSLRAWKEDPEGKEKTLRVEVRDRGMGIPARDLPRIFERFYRVDKARSRALGGTGLGLAIVRHIALAHGGSVGVESYEGEGSCFSLSLPLEAGGPRRDLPQA